MGRYLQGECENNLQQKWLYSAQLSYYGFIEILLLLVEIFFLYKTDVT